MIFFVILKTAPCPFLKFRIRFMISFIILKTASCPFLKFRIRFVISFIILKTFSCPFLTFMYIINLFLLTFKYCSYLISLLFDNHLVSILTNPSSLLYRKIWKSFTFLISSYISILSFEWIATSNVYLPYINGK